MDESLVGAEVTFSVAEGSYPGFLFALDMQYSADGIAFGLGSDEFELEEVKLGAGFIFEESSGTI